MLRLSVNHPLVEKIAQTIRRQPANALAYISGVRIDKRGLVEAGQKQIALPNARLEAIAKRQEEGQLHYYLLCNFKITFISEEKQEELRSVVMDVQAGHAVSDGALLRRLEIIDSEPFFADLPVAPPRWFQASEQAALSADVLQALIPRAEKALQRQLASQVAALTVRMQRHLTLDLARIQDYYDEMAGDLQKRQTRTGEEETERKQAFEDKLAVLEAERAAKLQDAQSRYTMRIEMSLINALLVGQAKVVLPVAISNRTASIQRTLIWDPLLHRIEPLVCDVCGEPGESLHLCTGGHLAHEKCLAPQCVDCKRAYCQLCASQISECVVCHRPLCKPSLLKCTTCGRSTCSEHRQLCHADQGQPATLPTAPPTPAVAIVPTARTATVAQSAAASISKTPTGKSTAATKSTPTKPTPTKPPAGKSPPAKPAPTNAAPTDATPIAKGVRIDVQILENKPEIVAFVMRSTNRVLATRSFELTPEGIYIRCECEKSPCPADSYYHRPVSVAGIQEQVEKHLRKLQQEYLVPAKKMIYYYKDGSQFEEEKHFRLPAIWREVDRVRQAILGFDAMARKK